MCRLNNYKDGLSKDQRRFRNVIKLQFDSNAAPCYCLKHFGLQESPTGLVCYTMLQEFFKPLNMYR